MNKNYIIKNKDLLKVLKKELIKNNKPDGRRYKK